MTTPSSPYETGSSTWVDVPESLRQIYQQGWGEVANQLATPYTAYENQRIAGLTPLQQQARDNVNNSALYMLKTYTGLENALANTPQAVAASASAPTVGGQVDMSQIQRFSPNLDKSKLSYTTGAWTDPGTAGAYMSPYTGQVVDRIAQLGQRNLQENLLPQVNSTFTGAGQFGSTRNADFTNRALRDANESILGQQAQALEAGYKTGSDIYGTDMARALQAQQGTASNLLAAENLGLQSTQAGNQSFLQGAGINANLAQAQAQIQAQIAGQNAQMATNVNLANQQAEQNRINQWMNMGSNAQRDFQNLVGMQTALGGEQQKLDQSNLDLAYGDYLNQQNYPMTQVKNAFDLINPTVSSTGGVTKNNSYIQPTTTPVQNWTSGLSALGQLYKSWT